MKHRRSQRHLLYLLVSIMSVVTFFVRGTYHNYGYSYKYDSHEISKSEIAQSVKNIDKKNVTVYIFHKSKCSTCIENEKLIVSEFEKVDKLIDSFYYINVDDGIPDEIKSVVTSDSLKNAKTPWIVVIDKDYRSFDDESIYEPVISQRLSDKETIERVEHSLEELLKQK